MPKRATVPEGKALFFRPPEPPPVGDAPEVAEEPVAPVAAGPRKTPTRQSAIFLEERHLDWLEDKCREARRNGGRAIRKAAIIRALLDLAAEAPIDLTTLRDEDELMDRIRRGFRV